MSRCIIHIGMHKTGSTSIQQSLQGYSDDRFMYARLGKAANHSLAIYSIFASEPGQHHLHANKRTPTEVTSYIARMSAELRRSIDDARGRTLLISGEDISSLSLAGVGRMRDFFATRFDQIDIVGYVRAPAGFMSSSFQQRVKGGSVRGVNPSHDYRNYKNNFGKFDEVFGRKHVRLWKFDPAVFPDGCAVRDFCGRLDIPLPHSEIIRLNESLSRQAVSLFYTYRRLGQAYGANTMRAPESEILAQFLEGIGRDKFRFSPDAVRPVLRKNRADIAWMEERLGTSLNEKLGKHRPGDIKVAADLLRPDPRTARQLVALLGPAAPEGVAGRNPREIALLMSVFRDTMRKTRPDAGWPPLSRLEQAGEKSAVWSDSMRGGAAAMIRGMMKRFRGG